MFTAAIYAIGILAFCWGLALWQAHREEKSRQPRVWGRPASCVRVLPKDAK